MPDYSARRARRAAKRRQEIMAIGKGMFLSRPYLQVSMEAIAEAADLSKATVYKYFSSKVEIYSAIILADAQMLADQIRAEFDSARSVSGNLRAMAHAYINFFFEHPEYFEKLSWFYLPGRDRHVSDSLIREVSLRVESARAAIEGCLKHAVRHGELRRIDAKAAAIVIYSQWLGLAYLAVASGTAKSKLHLDYEKLTDVACAQHLNGILLHPA
ncbi:MAG: TetR/AcrR family transcriptional regulator [Burkholderiales bacterium]|nr:TetR/AcrR family transcriptional regulator [Burkholderiales bacterium]